MTTGWRARWRSDGGVTLVEMLVVLLIGGIVATALLAWMTSAVRSANLHRDDDRAVQDLREAHERLTREVRTSSQLLDGSSTELTMWIDLDWDGTIGEGEVVTWSVTGGGSLVRSTDAGDEWEVITGLAPELSGFTLDAGTAAQSRVVGIGLAAFVGESDNVRTMNGQVFLRNAP